MDDNLFVFEAEGEAPPEPANWWTPSAFARREAQALVDYAQKQGREIDPAIAVQLTRLSLDGGFENHLSWLDGSQRLVAAPEATCAGMNEAGKLLSEAIEEGSLIAVFCDYDVDGTSAGAVLSWGLDRYQPNLFFGYADAATGFGLTRDFIDKAKAEGAALLITLDCGSGQGEEIAYAQSLGMKTIVVDHHQLSPDNPSDHHLNPLLFEPPSSVNTGAQLAWKLVAATQIARQGRTDETLWREPLYLAGLGCLADMGSVALPENRVFFRAANECPPPGLVLLAQELDEDPTKPGSLIATQACLNLPKRTDKVSAELSGTILAAKSEDEARVAVEQLLSVYLGARQIRLDMLSEIDSEAIGEDGLFFAYAVMPESYQGWAGYAGPVASSLSSQVGRPALVFVPRGKSESGENVYKFSGRGNGPPLGELIEDEAMRKACSVDGSPSIGGHRMVVSGACLEDNIEAVKEACESWAEKKNEKGDFARPEWDGPDAFPFERDVSPERFVAIEDQAQLLAPFGRGKQLVRIAQSNRTEEKVSHRQSEVSVRAILALGGDHQAPDGWQPATLHISDDIARPVCVPDEGEFPEQEVEWIVKLGRPGPYFLRTWHPL